MGREKKKKNQNPACSLVFYQHLLIYFKSWVEHE